MDKETKTPAERYLQNNKYDRRENLNTVLNWTSVTLAALMAGYVLNHLPDAPERAAAPRMDPPPSQVDYPHEVPVKVALPQRTPAQSTPPAFTPAPITPAPAATPLQAIPAASPTPEHKKTPKPDWNKRMKEPILNSPDPWFRA